MEMFVDEGQWVNTLKQKADYIKMYEYIIPQVLKEEDPQTFYWPASPSSGGSFDAPNDPTGGMCITGRYGTEISHFPNTVSIISGMPVSLDSSLFRV